MSRSGFTPTLGRREGAPEGTQPLTAAHLEELCLIRSTAKLGNENFAEAVKAVAEKCGISRAALRRFVCAKVDDRLAALDSEANDIAHLLETK